MKQVTPKRRNSDKLPKRPKSGKQESNSSFPMPILRRSSSKALSAKSAAYSEAGSFVREKKYLTNQKKLAERLERERPAGLAGL